MVPWQPAVTEKLQLPIIFPFYILQLAFLLLTSPAVQGKRQPTTKEIHSNKNCKAPKLISLSNRNSLPLPYVCPADVQHKYDRQKLNSAHHIQGQHHVAQNSVPPSSGDQIHVRILNFPPQQPNTSVQKWIRQPIIIKTSVKYHTLGPTNNRPTH